MLKAMRLPTQLLRRKKTSHKGDFGHILIIAGSRSFSGAAILCAAAAMRCGAGSVTLAIPESINNAVIKIKPLEVMTLPLPETTSGTIGQRATATITRQTLRADIVVLGPGMSLNNQTKALAKNVIARCSKPLIIDADGLNALAHCKKILRTSKRPFTLLTPHPGEMSRLTGETIKNIQIHRKNTALVTAKSLGAIIVLKGKNTVVADPRGKTYINKTGNPGMATAGSGDVLTGMIAALCAQKLSAFDAAKFGVYLHGLAGDLAAKEKTEISLIASDIIAKIPEAVKRAR